MSTRQSLLLTAMVVAATTIGAVGTAGARDPSPPLVPCYRDFSTKQWICPPIAEQP
jgi:hypothetical protein